MTTSTKVRTYSWGGVRTALMALAMFVLALGVALAAPAPAQAADTTHTVRFETFDPDIDGSWYRVFPDGQRTRTIQVEDGTAIGIDYFSDWENTPSDVSETHYPFFYWAKVDSKTGKISSVWYPDAPVTSDMTLRAVFGNSTTTPYVSFVYTIGDKEAVIAAGYIGEDSKVAQPADPVREGYTFAGWYKNRACTKAFDFNTELKDFKTVYAKFVAKQYTVTFNANGGSGDTTQQVDYGTAAKAPEGVTRTGYTLAGWYTDAACTDGNEYNLDTLVTGEVTLYAKWTLNTYTVSFDTKGGTPATVDSQTVQFGGKVTKPENPTKEGDGFYAWCTEDGKKWDFDNDTVQGDMTLHAEWVEGGNDGIDDSGKSDENDGAKKDASKESASEKKGSKKAIPQTGDNALIAICIAGAAGIAAVAGGFAVRRRKE